MEAAIAQRVDLNVRSQLFGSALHVACDRDDKEMAELLLRSGAHADSVPILSLAPLHSFETFYFYVQTHAKDNASVNDDGQSVHEQLIEWFCCNNERPSELIIFFLL